MSICLDCGCDEFVNCLQTLNLILDGEATDDQELFFLNHIKECSVCFSHCNIEKQIRALLKSKLTNTPVPNELAEEIRSRIFS